MSSPCSISENDDTQSSSKTSKPTTSSTQQSGGEKCCKICGDRAVGYNFSVISCESCKAFFRRNANREKELNCPFKNNCEITRISRRFCQSCRLKKCFEVGMKKEWVLIERSRRSKKRRLTSVPNSTDGINKMFEEIGEGEVTVTKDVLIDLVKKSNSTSQPSSCQCKCTCGFYPPDTQLTALVKPYNLSSTQLASTNFNDILSNALSTSLNNQDVQRTINYNQAPKNIITSTGAECSRSKMMMVSELRSDCNTTLRRPSSIISPSPNGAFTSTTTPYLTAQPSIMNASNNHSQSPFVNAINASSIYGDPEPSSSSYSGGGGLAMNAANLVRQSNPNTAVVPTVQATDVFVKFDQYSRIIDSTNRAVEAHSSLFMLPLGLSERERFLMQELILANCILKQPLDMSMKQRTTDELTLMDVVRMTDLALRRIINMAKDLLFFRELSQDDQIAVLKGSCSELLILRGVMAFDPTKDVWNHHVIQGSSGIEIKLDVLKGSKESHHYEEHKRFLMTFSEKWRRNESVMLLLSAITLFCPDRCNLKNPENIRAKQLEYYHLLKKYLHLLCPPAEAQQAYDMLLGKLVDLHQLNQSLLRIYYGLNTKEVAPLLLELFDLAQHGQ